MYTGLYRAGMAAKKMYKGLEDSLLDCKSVFIGKSDLFYFEKINEIKEDIKKIGQINNFNLSLVSKYKNSAEIDFYAISNIYQIENKLKEISSRYSLGLAYRISITSDSS